MKQVKYLEKHLEELIMILLVIGIVSVMTAHVVLRYFFKAPLVWAEEACRYMFVWITFMSIGYCVRNNMLLNVDALLSKLPYSLRTITEVISSILTLALFVILLYKSYSVVLVISNSGQKSPALGIPMQYIYGSSLVGFFLGTFRYIQFLIRKYFYDGVEEKNRLETTSN